MTGQSGDHSASTRTGCALIPTAPNPGARPHDPVLPRRGRIHRTCARRA